MQQIRILILAVLIASCQSALSAEIHDVTRAGDLETLKLMIQSGADINDIDYLQGSPLHIAASKGYTELVEFLLQNDADYAAEEFGKSDTPLHWAALGGNTDVINLLLAAGADINATNDIQNTPLLIAVDSGHPDAAILLIESGAVFTIKNFKGQAVLQLAAAAGFTDVVDTLVEKGVQYELTEFVSPLLKSADLQDGKDQWDTKCSACHTLDHHDPRDGPSLWNIVGRDIGSISSFEYSNAFRTAEGVWDYENLNALMLDSRNFWPGNVMGWASYDEIVVPSVQTRANIIAYLRTQSDNPVPLPE